jgi:hypothetical protein
MTRWRLKACPRCGGDTYIDNDSDGWYEQCLQCAHRLELRELTLAKKRPVAVTRDRDVEDDE